MGATRDNHLAASLHRAVSRRTAVRGIGGGIAAAAGLATIRHTGAAETVDTTAMIEPDAGSWRTWVLSEGDQLRLPAPPDSKTELNAVQNQVAKRDAAAMDRISYWDAGSPGYRWNEIAMQQTLKAKHGPGDAYRTMAYLNVAIYDATIAAWDSKYAHERPRPASADSALTTAIPTPASPSYPCEHAVTAGAASTVLSYLFPDDAEALADLAKEAADSRIVAGVAYPSDTAAGLDLGREVGNQIVARAKEDGFDVPFDPASMPTGAEFWAGEPVYPTLGTWQTWVLPDGSAMRPPPPPAWDSAERAAELDEVKSYPRDVHPFEELFFWPENPAGRPAPDSTPVSSNQVVFYYAPVLHYLWNPELSKKVFEYRWDINPPRAARAYALVSVAGFDATVACWDAKFFYWTPRPNQFDPSIETVLPTYPIPDYPSGHAATLGGTAQVLAYLFPRDAHYFQSRADENAASRLWAGIHFRSACEVGVQLGRSVGQAVVEHAMSDGAAIEAETTGSRGQPY